MASTELTALVVALIALVIALLQVVQQYVGSAVVRGKVNRAAISTMSHRNKFWWSLHEWKLGILYAQVKLSAEDAIPLMGGISPILARLASMHLDYTFGWEAEKPGRPDRQPTGRLTIRRRGDESQELVPRSALTINQRLLIRRIEKDLQNLHRRAQSCKATWCNMVMDLRIDPSELPLDDYQDADTIAAALDAPMMQIQMSDLILFGFLLDMEVSQFNLQDRVLDMVGKHCNITTQPQQGVGMLTRYSGMSSHIQPAAFTCSPAELSTLVRNAAGALHIGDSAFYMERFGYNTVDLILSTAHDRARGSAWQEIKVADVMEDLDADSNIRWEGRWINPTVPVVPFLLSLAGNLAVCNSFPHRNLTPWTSDQRATASRAAYTHVQHSVDFVEAPLNLFRIMQTRDIEIVIMDNFKTANFWGSEYGGIRSWLCTNFAEFAVRMSKCWIVDVMTDHVPLLPQLSAALRDGKLDTNWSKHYEADLGHNDRGKGWSMTTNSLYWTQIMMFDTWIARHVEVIMGERLDADLSIPVDISTAVVSAGLEANKSQITGWKKSRLAFTRQYLKRLAEGKDGMGASCMTVGPRHEPGHGWEDMPSGHSKEWADIDAVLTLRAVVMVARMEFMKDSTALLDLKRLDPILQMA